MIYIEICDTSSLLMFERVVAAPVVTEVVFENFYILLVLI